MKNPKRLITATISGAFFGYICFILASSGPEPLAFPVVVQIIASRTLIGIAIGMSSLSLGHWSIHGLMMGLLFSIPLAFSGLMAPDSPEFSKSAVFIWTLVLGSVYGLLIELIVTKLFKAKAPVPALES